MQFPQERSKAFEKAKPQWMNQGVQGMRIIAIDPGSTTMITAARWGGRVQVLLSEIQLRLLPLGCCDLTTRIFWEELTSAHVGSSHHVFSKL